MLGIASKALREWKCQYQIAGELTEEGKEKWAKRSKSFCGPKDPKTKKATAQSLADDHVANIQDIRALDNTLRHSLGVEGVKKFLAYHPCGPLGRDEERQFVKVEKLPPALLAAAHGRTRRSCIVKAGDLSKARMEVAWSAPRCILHTWLDQGAVGWYGKFALYLGFDVRGTFMFDPAHRRWNDILNAMTASGLHLLKLEILLIQTWLSGPFKGDGHFRRLEDAVEEWVKSSNYEDPLWEIMYPIVVRDLGQGKLPADYNSEAHKEELFLSLPRLAKEFLYYMNTKRNRWFQLIRKHQVLKKYWSVTLTCALYVCISQGLYDNIEDTPLFRHKPGAAPPAEGAAGPRVMGVDPITAVVNRSVKFSNDELSRLRAGTQNGFHLAANILCMFETKALMTGVQLISTPVAAEHGLAITKMKSRSGTKHWRCEQSKGTNLTHLNDCIAVLHDQDMLLEMGLIDFTHAGERCEFSDETACRIATTLSTYLRHVLNNEVLFQLAYSCDLPNSFCGLVHDDVLVVEEAATWHASVLAQVTKLEAAGIDDMWAKKYCANLVWTGMTWCREVLVALAECAPHKRLPKDIFGEVHAFAIGWGTTKPNEDLFNHLRKCEKFSASGKLDGMALWHHSMTSTILKESDCTEMTPTVQERTKATTVNRKAACGACASCLVLMHVLCECACACAGVSAIAIVCAWCSVLCALCIVHCALCPCLLVCLLMCNASCFGRC